jgi:hypothetical protein
MSIKIMVWTFEQSPTAGSERLVLLSLADNASDQGYCWPSLATIARKSSLDRRSVIRLITRLQAKGIITVQRRFQGLTNDTNMYRICWTDEIRGAEQVTEAYNTALKAFRGGDTESLGVVTLSHYPGDTESLGVVTHGHQGSDTESPKSLINHQLNHHLNPIENPPPPTSSRSTTAKEEEGLPNLLREELINFGIFSEVMPRVFETMAARKLDADDVRQVLNHLRKTEPERGPALFLTRLNNARHTESANGYAHLNSVRCTRCNHNFGEDFVIVLGEKDVCLDCLTEEEYAAYQEGND